MRSRGAGADPRQALARAPGRRLGTLVAALRSLLFFPAALPLVFLLPLLSGCAGGPHPPSAGGGAPPVQGTRALYDGRSEAEGEKHRFRLAVAFAPPDRLRLELFPAVGGARLVVTGDGRRLLAIDPAERRAQVWDRESDGIARLLGAAIGAAEIRILLEGRPPCTEQAGGRADGDGGCVFGAARFLPRRGSAGEVGRGGRLVDPDGNTLIEIDYPEEGTAATAGDAHWPRALLLTRPANGSLVRLTLASGPLPADLAPALFETAFPPGFESAPVLAEDGRAVPFGMEGAP